MGSSPAETWNSFYPMAECCVVEVYILSFYMKLSETRQMPPINFNININVLK